MDANEYKDIIRSIIKHGLQRIVYLSLVDINIIPYKPFNLTSVRDKMKKIKGKKKSLYSLRIFLIKI